MNEKRVKTAYSGRGTVLRLRRDGGQIGRANGGGVMRDGIRDAGGCGEGTAARD